VRHGPAAEPERTILKKKLCAEIMIRLRSRGENENSAAEHIDDARAAS